MRSKNEDALLVDDAHGLFAVADGIGGLPHGDDASKTAIEVLRKAAASGEGAPWLPLAALFVEANRAVVDMGHKLKLSYNTGTTLTAAQVVGSELRFAHVGDSALYRIHDGDCDKLTCDHTVAEDAAYAWLASSDHYTAAQQKNVLTRCIGAADDPLVDTGKAELRPGLWFMLTTDGLFKGVHPGEVAPWFTDQADPKILVEKLIALINSRGGPDNVTVIVIKCLAA